jgi:hypothetical protein
VWKNRSSLVQLSPDTNKSRKVPDTDKDCSLELRQLKKIVDRKRMEKQNR